VLGVTGAPAVVGWLGFLIGWGMTYLTGRHAVRRLSDFVSTDQPLGSQLRALGLFAWLLGAALVILVSGGLLTAGGVGADVVVFEAFGVLSSGIFLVFVRLFLPSVQVGVADRTVDFRPPWWGLGALLALAVARQVAFAGGITL
jgi:hypothetical protein